MKAITLRPIFRYAGLGVAKYSDDHFRFTQKIVTELRQLNYTDQWKLSRTNCWYHVLLEDLSYFSFSEFGGKPSYGFYPCPLEVQSHTEYIQSLGIEPTKKNKLETLNDYDISIETSNLKDFITPVRYDVDFNAYRSGVHPAAHVHIGIDNQIRIATRRVLNPTAFVLFIIRQLYPDNWARLLKYSDELKITRKIRENLPEVDEKHWNEIDDAQCYLY